MIALAAVMVACGPRSSSSTAALDFVDPEGRPVAIEHLPVRRIVSTSQAMTEWIVALGSPELMVARTDYDREPALASLPSIGGGLDPSPEAIAALHPDVIIGWRNRSSADLLQALAPFHVPVISFETTDTADVFLNLHRIGLLIGKSVAADSAAARLRDELAQLHASACPGGIEHAESAFLEVGIDPPMTAGPATWMSTILGVACLRNAFGDLTATWPTVSLEAIASRDPHWIVTSLGKHPGDRLTDLRGRPGWRDLAAVKAGRVLEIPGDLFARGGPTIAEAARAIVAARKAASDH